VTQDHAVTDAPDDPSPDDFSAEDPSTAARPGRRARVLVIAGSLVVALIAVGAAARGGLVPGALLLSGPLEASGPGMTAPFQPGDTGMLVGMDLENRSGFTIVLDSVEVAKNPNHVKLLRDPFLWDNGNVPGSGEISSSKIPPPAKWNVLPKRAVQGYTIHSGTWSRSEDPSKYDGPSPEMLFEFAKPARTSEVSGVTVRYHIGWFTFQRTFDNFSVTMCPPTDMGPCGF